MKGNTNGTPPTKWKRKGKGAKPRMRREVRVRRLVLPKRSRGAVSNWHQKNLFLTFYHFVLTPNFSSRCIISVSWISIFRLVNATSPDWYVNEAGDHCDWKDQRTSRIRQKDGFYSAISLTEGVLAHMLSLKAPARSGKIYLLCYYISRYMYLEVGTWLEA